jgi:predicted nucleic acid-binding protein
LEVLTVRQAAAVALRFGSTLVTLDREQRERVAGVVPSRLPAEALGEWS